MKINAFCEGLFQAVNTGCCIPVKEHIVPFKSISYQYTAPLRRAARKETLLIKLVRRDNREAGFVLTSLHGIKLLCFSSYFFRLGNVQVLRAWTVVCVSIKGNSTDFPMLTVRQTFWFLYLISLLYSSIVNSRWNSTRSPFLPYLYPFATFVFFLFHALSFSDKTVN
jgi:hypothetical protein